MSSPSPEVIDKARQIKLLVLDVDGVLSDGKLYFSAQGDELKAFNILDGHGIKMLRSQGIEVGIITGRNSPIVARRARDLGIELIFQGREDKRVALDEMTRDVGIALDQTAYMGDDLPDLGALVSAQLGFTVPNAHEFVQEHADYCTTRRGGEGAVREVCDLILQAQDKLDNLHAAYLN